MHSKYSLVSRRPWGLNSYSLIFNHSHEMLVGVVIGTLPGDESDRMLQGVSSTVTNYVIIKIIIM